jgi:hypothetical protein
MTSSTSDARLAGGGTFMSSQFIDLNAPPLQGKLPKLPQDLPRGLLTPPDRVREEIERERQKHPPEAFAKAEEDLLNLWTICYYFDYLNHEVIYRPTPQGPEVLAVGFDEALALKRSLPLDELAKLKFFLGY